MSPRTPCTSSSRTRRDRRRATTWSRLDSLPCVTTSRVCDQRSSGSKPIYVLRSCRHFSTAASKPKSVAGPSHPARLPVRQRDDAPPTLTAPARQPRPRPPRPHTHGRNTCTIRTPPRQRALRTHPQRHPRRRARHVSRAENPRRLGRGEPPTDRQYSSWPPAPPSWTSRNNARGQRDRFRNRSERAAFRRRRGCSFGRSSHHLTVELPAAGRCSRTIGAAQAARAKQYPREDERGSRPAGCSAYRNSPDPRFSIVCARFAD